MKSMAYERVEKEKEATESLVSSMPKYPYGLCIHVDPHVYKKLQLMKAPQVGQTMALHAMVEVVGVNMEDSKTGSKDISLKLQITDMILKDKQEKRNPEKALYNDDDEG
jgi:hypothetical protein